MIRILLALGLLLGLCWQAEAANCNAAAGSCFWIGGTGTLDLATDSAHWSNSTGGASCSCEPTGTSTLTFDGSSGGGTVTINTNITLTGASAQIASGAFTGTLDWSANNNTLTIPVWNNSGSGLRTINTGTGAWTIGSNGSATSCFAHATATGLTWNQNNNITITCGGTISLGTVGSYSTITFAPASGHVPDVTGSGTIANLAITAPGTIAMGGTINVANAATLIGTSTLPIAIVSATPATSVNTLSLGSASTCVWCAFEGTTVTGAGSMTATNSLNLGANTNITITPPSTGGGGGGGGGTGGGNSFIGVTTVFGLGSH